MPDNPDAPEPEAEPVDAWREAAARERRRLFAATPHPKVSLQEHMARRARGLKSELLYDRPLDAFFSTHGHGSRGGRARKG